MVSKSKKNPNQWAEIFFERTSSTLSKRNIGPCFEKHLITSIIIVKSKSFGKMTKESSNVYLYNQKNIRRYETSCCQEGTSSTTYFNKREWQDALLEQEPSVQTPNVVINVPKRIIIPS